MVVEAVAAPVVASGVHPDRQRILDQSAKSTKRAREVDPVPAPATTNTKPAPSAIAETTTKAERFFVDTVPSPIKVEKPKKVKKEKKGKNVVPPTTDTPHTITPSSELPPAILAIPELSLSAFLNILVPSLLLVAMPFRDLRDLVVVKAGEAGFKDVDLVRDTIERGIKLGGKKLKISFDFSTPKAA